MSTGSTAAGPPGRRAHAPRGGLRVVVVDDTEVDRWFFAEVARAHGHLVVVCDSGEMAVESFGDALPDLVMLDLLLPGMDGVEVCRRLRAMPGGQRPFVLVVTGRMDPDALKEVLAAGADDFVRKPVDPEVLAIRLTIAERRLESDEVLRRAEDALASRTREIETLFTNVPDVFFSVDVTEGRLIQVSPGVKRLFGHGADELAGEDALWRRYLLPAGEAGSDPWARLREEGPSAPHVGEYAITTPEGEKRWIRLSVQVFPDRQRGGLRADGVATDVTEEYLARRQLAERNLELAALHGLAEATLAGSTLSETYAGILDLVRDTLEWPIAGIELVADDGELMHLAALEPIALPSHEPVTVALHRSPSAPAVQSGAPYVETSARVLAEHARATPLPDELAAFVAFPLLAAGQPVGTLFLASAQEREVDDRVLALGSSLANALASYVAQLDHEEALRDSERRHRELAAQLREANQELESFAYSVSHDLRAPLRTMQGFAHSLMQQFGASLPDTAADYARRIIASGRRSEELIADLLSYSRLSFEELEVKPVDLSAVVEAAREQVGADLSESGAELTVDGELPTVLASHTALVQVVANLISNAIKFVRPGESPRIRIHAEPEDGRVRLWVEDNGIGIPEGQEERIFRVFERLSEDAGRPGTGIGLAIVRRAVQRIGGGCGVQPRPEGGSAFWIEVPLERRARRRGPPRR